MSVKYKRCSQTVLGRALRDLNQLSCGAGEEKGQERMA